MPWINLEELVAVDPPSPREAREVLDNLAKRAKARFYADENFPPKAAAILRDLGARVVTAQEAGLVGHPDENHVAYARKNGFVLVTCDRDFLDERRHPLIQCPAIFVFDFGSASTPEIRRAFRCFSTVFRMPQFFDKWWKVDAKRDSWSEYVRHQDGTTDRSRFRLWRGRLQEWASDS
jgi:predicted nuclease of predicted toxin-antitoxin system